MPVDRTPRAITGDEVAVIRAALAVADTELSPALSEHLEDRVVVGGCACGCPSISLHPDAEAGQKTETHCLVDALGRTESGRYVLVLVFGTPETILALEIHPFSAEREDGALPLPASIRRGNSVREAFGAT